MLAESHRLNTSRARIGKSKAVSIQKIQNDLVDASGAHFKVGDASRSGGRAPAKAAKAAKASRARKFHLGFALLALAALAGARPPLLEASLTLK